MRSTTEEFIKKAKKVHGDHFGYSKVIYKSNKKKICIECPEHGEFYQTPANHLRGNGCPKCVGREKSTSEFISESNKVHNNKYSYTKSEYINATKPICIECPEHGEFWQTPTNHIHGNGCPKCAYKTIQKSNSKIINANRYTYNDFTGTISEIIEHFNLNIKSTTVNERIKRGYNVSDAFDKKVSTHKRIITYKGYTGSIRDIVEHFNLKIKPNLILSRMNKGMSVEEAIETRVKKIGRKTYTYKGFTGSIREIIEQFNLDIKIETVRNRLNKQNMSIKEALECKDKKIISKTVFTYKGFQGTVREIINKFNLDIKPEYIFGKIKDFGDIESVIDNYCNNKPTTYLYKGEELTITAIAKRENINWSALSKALTNSESKENIYDIVQKIKANKRIYGYCNDGFKGTIKQCLEHMNKKPDDWTIKQILKVLRKEDVSIEEALNRIEIENRHIQKYKLSSGFEGTVSECLKELGVELTNSKYSRLFSYINIGFTFEEALSML